MGKSDVIIVNYNAGRHLSDCVASVLAEEPLAVIVIDNGSTDGSLECVEQTFQDERLSIIRNGKNLGFAAACNIGIRHSSFANHLLFFNPDATLPSGTLKRLTEALESSADIGMVGAFLCNPDGTEQAGGRRVIPTPRRAFVRAFGLSRLAELFPGLFSDFLLHREPLPWKPSPVEAISGACMLVKRAALEQVGFWDEGYFLHCEDLDLCMRFRQRGYQVVFVPDAKVFHHRGACSRSRPIFVEWHKHRGMIRFYNKFFRATYPGVLMGLVTIAVWFRFIAMAGWHVTRRVMERAGAGSPEPSPSDLPVARLRLGDYGASPAKSVVVTGATSQIATFLLPRLTAAGYTVHALSRSPVGHDEARVHWHRVDIARDELADVPAETLIHLAPLPLLPAFLQRLTDGPLERVIAFGSTSLFSKRDSRDPKEREFARALADAEAAIAAYCEPRGIVWTVFRPTLIYGCGMDKNIAAITRFIRRFGFFPVIGDGRGLRQPVHADDLAQACVAIMDHPDAFNRAYDLTGAETLTYRAMVERIFTTEARKPRFLGVPLSLFQAAMKVASRWPGYRHLSGEMATRMIVDLCFDHAEATRGFGYAPRCFEPPRSSS
jgi:GT2 family glycosyltransferase/nucleoside-diphosphate-sugar epimerase